MNLKLYGICFKMRGGPNFLEYVQKGESVPVNMMEQVMARMESITKEEMDFAKKLETDWKKAFNERIPILMNIAKDGSYDITCTVPDELLSVVNILYGLENEKIVEEYTADYLKNVCGIDAAIISVDVEKETAGAVKAEKPVGFDLSDLGISPEEPAFEDVSKFAAAEILEDTDKEPAMEEPAAFDGEMDEGYEEAPDEELLANVSPEEDYPEEDYPEDIPDEMPDYPEEDEMPDEEEAEPENMDGEGNEEEQPSGEDAYTDALKDIYTDLVGNIKEKKLDERLGLKIGQ